LVVASPLQANGAPEESLPRCSFGLAARGARSIGPYGHPA
jgi:hypothetical protein